MKRITSPVLLLAVLVAGGPARGDNSIEAFRETLIDYFQPQGYFPIIVNRGYQIGDIVNVDLVNLYARAGRCFPGLKLPDPVKTSLPDAVNVYD